MEAKVYNQEGQETGTINLPTDVFGVAWNGDLVHQVVTSRQTSRRANTAQVKDRGAVSGGGRKPWRQKGTGRARHGSTRSPLWRGGGATHGPTTARNYSRKVNSQMQKQALASALGRKWRDQEIIFLDQLKLAASKTKMAAALLANLAKLPGCARLGYRSGRRALLALPERDQATARAFRNWGSALVTETRNLNLLDALAYKYLVVVDPKRSLAVLQSRLGRPENQDHV